MRILAEGITGQVSHLVPGTWLYSDFKIYTRIVSHRRAAVDTFGADGIMCSSTIDTFITSYHEDESFGRASAPSTELNLTKVIPDGLETKHVTG